MGGASSKAGSNPVGIDPEASLQSSLQVVQQLNIHKVSSPETKKTLPTLRQGLGEVFFPDDPLHQFKDQPFLKKLILALHYFIPILQWALEYNLQFLKCDVIAGLTIASLAIPQGISYAKLANLPPIIGLYSSFVPPLVYAALGSSRDLAIGAGSIPSLVMGTMLSNAVSPNNDSTLYLQLAFTATFFAGVFQASLGLFRLGFVMDFLSKPTLMGFMAGSALTTAMQQLKNFLGMTHFTNQTKLVDALQSVFKHRDEWTLKAIVMGFSFIAVILIAKAESARRPKLVWVSALAPIVCMIISTIFVFETKAQNHGIQIIGHVQESINPPSTQLLLFQGPHLGTAIKVGVAIGVLSLADSLAVGRTYGYLKNYKIDGNKEMMSIGLMNMIGSCTSCYVTSGSVSRSAVNNTAGCKTAASNIVMALVVLVIMRFLMPLVCYTPNVMLSAIIVAAVINLIDFSVAIQLWKVDKVDFVTYVTAFLGVIFFSIEMGLFIAVGISIFKILMHVTRPNIVIMGNVPGTQSYRNLEQYKDASRATSFLILGIESPIYFANSNYFQERILRWVREEEDRAMIMKESTIRCVILDLSTVTAIDTTGIDALLELKKTLKKKSLQLVLANPVEHVARKLRASKALEEFGSKRIYMRIDEAIAAVSCLLERLPKETTINRRFWIVYENQMYRDVNA